MNEPAETRQERKLRSRQALIDGALSLVQQQGFAALSLREVARSAELVPTAFYRHFESMDELGEALVSQSMQKLRTVTLNAELATSTAVLARRLIDRIEHEPAALRLLIAERFGGSAKLRASIAGQLQLLTADLAVDLARVHTLNDYDSTDLRDLADLVVTTILAIAGALLDCAEIDSPQRQDVIRRGEHQLRMLLLQQADGP